MIVINRTTDGYVLNCMHTGKLHGKGTLIYADGTMVVCEFEHGKYIVPSSHHIDDTIHDKQPQQDDHDDHDVNTTTIDATKLQQENPQQQLPSSTAVLTGKQSRRVKKSREVETAGYTPLNLSLLNGSDNNNNNINNNNNNNNNIELGLSRRDRVILKPHQYS